MYTTKSLLSFIVLLLFSNIPLFAQAPFILEPENINEVLEHIEEAYGSQIEINLDEINVFLTEAINANNYSGNCQTPETNIVEYNPELIAFEWDTPLDDVIYFEHRSLDLYTGATEYGITDEGYAEYNISSGFYLFLFNSVCPNQKVSKANIIIVDKDVMLNGPPELQSCNCKTPIQISLTKSPAPPGSPWPILGYAQFSFPNTPSCAITKYIIDIDDVTTSYEASAFFVHESNTSPQNIYIHPLCSNNLNLISGTSLYAGDPGKYHLEFNSNIRINIEDPDIMASGKIELTRCKCRRTRIFEEQVFKKRFESKVLKYQNPVKDDLTIDVTLAQSGSIKLQLLDLFGKPISNIVLNNREQGIHQIKIPMSHLASGIYTCTIEHNNHPETIKIIKIK